MDHGSVERHLAVAEHHVRLAEGRVQQQRSLLAKLELHGHRTEDARLLLGNLEDLLATHLKNRDGLRAQLPGD